MKKVIQTKEYREMQRRNSRYKRALKRDATPQERIVKVFLETHEIPFIFQKGFFNPFHRIVDFYFPRLALLLEIDGPIHMGRREADRRKDQTAAARGMVTLRVSNREVDGWKL
jgi:very-short-patch-repair endonuclease